MSVEKDSHGDQGIVAVIMAESTEIFQEVQPLQEDLQRKKQSRGSLQLDHILTNTSLEGSLCMELTIRAPLKWCVVLTLETGVEWAGYRLLIMTELF